MTAPGRILLVVNPPAAPAPPTAEHVMELMRGVIDPELGSDIVELGMAKGATVSDDGVVRLDIALTTSGCPLRAQIQRDIRSRLTSLPGVNAVKITWGELTQDERSEAIGPLGALVSGEYSWPRSILFSTELDTEAAAGFLTGTDTCSPATFA